MTRSRRTIEAALGTRAARALEGMGADLSVLAALADEHARLWQLEDSARSALAPPSEIARIKGEIDRANGRRHHLVDAFDTSTTGPSAQGEPSRAYSETLGELCDRLIVLSLKLTSCNALAGNAELPEAERDRCALQVERLTRWRDHLRGCLEEQIESLAAGRAQLPPRAELKLYNDPLLNPVTRAERKGS